MARTIEVFDAVSVTNASVQFKNTTTNSYEAGTSFGCIGSIEGETEVVNKALKCGADTKKQITKASKMTLKVVLASVPIAVARNVFGLSNDGLKEGVYSYGSMSKGKDFIFTADVIDEFEEITKLIAFPNASNTTGFKIQTIENGAEEVANIEFELTALPDSQGQIYYEAYEEQVTDASVKTKWHTQFTRELVEATEIV